MYEICIGGFKDTKAIFHSIQSEVIAQPTPLNIDNSGAEQSLYGVQYSSLQHTSAVSILKILPESTPDNHPHGPYLQWNAHAPRTSSTSLDIRKRTDRIDPLFRFRMHVLPSYQSLDPSRIV